MRFLKWVILVIGTLAILLVVGGFTLPREVSVTRSVDIEASASNVFVHVNSMQASVGWSPWLGIDPEI
jgi:hypothetical protein